MKKGRNAYRDFQKNNLSCNYFTEQPIEIKQKSAIKCYQKLGTAKSANT